MKKLLLLFIILQSIQLSAQTIGLNQFATGFTNPVEITHAGDSRLFVVEQGGRIKIINPDGSVNATPFLNISSIITSGGERGLLGLAFHPAYASNGLFFVNYTNTSGNTVIARYSVNSSNPNSANSTGTILMTITQPYINHNGGSIKFGSDGYLYIGMGDGGSGGDPGNRAQNINENLGKMLRIDVNSNVSPFYTIPPTNPYVGIAGNDEIWAIGLRNPWKFSFNRLNGDLWIADVGQSAIEEIDKIASPLPNTGINFGWRCYEGNSVYNNVGCAASSTMTFPFAQYNRTGGACSVTGGYVYTGTMYPNFQNKYFFTDYCDDKIRILDSNGIISTSASFSGNNFVTFGEDFSGELYLGGITSGSIYKIIDTSLSNTTFEAEGYSISPNPATNDIYIKSNNMKSEFEISIYDSSGKTVLENQLINSNSPISITNYSNGLYIVKLKDNQGNSCISKIIKE